MSTQNLTIDEPVLLGSGPAMEWLRAAAARVAGGHAKVLITGESGVGKDLVARFIHARSPRASRAFVALNCAGISETLLESELFGHVRGSFTGAHRDKIGMFQLADKGTVFLDEVGEMSLRMQALLLRFLENGEVKPVGSDRVSAKVDVRVIAATNRNLEEEVTAGKFREDLFYRLQVMPIVLPPLRERHGDVARLARFYLARFNAEFKKRVKGLSPAAQGLLDEYTWPGNVRELRNALERAMLLADRETLEPGDFTTLTRSVSPTQFKLPAEGVNLEDVERQLVVQALERAGHNQTRAAELLGLNRDQVRYRMEKFGLRQT